MLCSLAKHACTVLGQSSFVTFELSVFQNMYSIFPIIVRPRKHCLSGIALFQAPIHTVFHYSCDARATIRTFLLLQYLQIPERSSAHSPSSTISSSNPRAEFSRRRCIVASAKLPVLAISSHQNEIIICYKWHKPLNHFSVSKMGKGGRAAAFRAYGESQRRARENKTKLERIAEAISLFLKYKI